MQYVYTSHNTCTPHAIQVQIIFSDELSSKHVVSQLQVLFVFLAFVTSAQNAQVWLAEITANNCIKTLCSTALLKLKYHDWLLRADSVAVTIGKKETKKGLFCSAVKHRH